MVVAAALRDTRTTMNVMPLPHPAPRRSPADDAYSAWFNAQQRCTAALRAWNAAPRTCRAAAHRAYLLELDFEETTAEEFERLHRQRLAA
jgi:hypothetical protein